jgi:hypothetical protein
MVRCAVSLAQRLEENVAKILVMDIERRPAIAQIWDQKTRFVPVRNWLRMPETLCWAGQWYGEPDMQFHAAWTSRDDMVLASWEAFDKADIVVGWNSVSFDEKHLRSDWLLAGLDPPRPWKSVDLFRVVRSTFGFESNSLGHVTKRLGIPTKEGFYDMQMCEAALAGDVEAQDSMQAYNEADVTATLAAYVRLLPWIKRHPHVAELPAGDPNAATCNRCGSSDLAREGTYRAVQINYLLYRCRDCGGTVRGTRHSRAAITHGV